MSGGGANEVGGARLVGGGGGIIAEKTNRLVCQVRLTVTFIHSYTQIVCIFLSIKAKSQPLL